MTTPTPVPESSPPLAPGEHDIALTQLEKEYVLEAELARQRNHELVERQHDQQVTLLAKLRGVPEGAEFFVGIDPKTDVAHLRWRPRTQAPVGPNGEQPPLVDDSERAAEAVQGLALVKG